MNAFSQTSQRTPFAATMFTNPFDLFENIFNNRDSGFGHNIFEKHTSFGGNLNNFFSTSQTTTMNVLPNGKHVSKTVTTKKYPDGTVETNTVEKINGEIISENKKLIKNE